MIQLSIILASLIVAYIISLISEIYSISKKGSYIPTGLYFGIILKSFSFDFINKLLNTTTKEERKVILKNLVIRESGISIKKNFSTRVHACEILAVVASVTVFSNLSVPRQTCLKKEETQQIVKITPDHTTYTFKL